MKTVEWHEAGKDSAGLSSGAEVWLIDQTRLPREEVIVRCRDVDSIVEAIRTMRVRGAPAIGVTAAMGIALGALHAPSDPTRFWPELERLYTLFAGTRPTAVNLFWAIDRMRRRAESRRGHAVDDVRAALVEEARRIAAEDEAACRRIGEHGERLFHDGDVVLTHCNAGALATVDYGTALAPLRRAHERGKRVHVYVDETRPFLQGARLTAWELARAGIDCTLITDNMAAHFMARGHIQRIIVGADRIAANGDVANKIGTYGLAVLAAAHGIPFYVAAPTSTIDLSLASGEAIPIEERDPSEVTLVFGVPVAPAGVKAAHPAFDITPHRYVTAIITERGIVTPPYDETLAALVQQAQAAHVAPGAAPSGSTASVAPAAHAAQASQEYTHDHLGPRPSIG